MTDLDRLIEAVARAICTERCAFYGDPPCHMAAAAIHAVQDFTPEAGNSSASLTSSAVPEGKGE